MFLQYTIYCPRCKVHSGIGKVTKRLFKRDHSRYAGVHPQSGYVLIRKKSYDFYIENIKAMRRGNQCKRVMGGRGKKTRLMCHLNKGHKGRHKGTTLF